MGLACCVLAAVPSTLFDLDRHAVPKELFLHLTALVAATALLASADEVRLSKLDVALAAWLAVGAASALGAENPWLAQRSLAINLSGVVIFWVSRTLARQGLSPRLTGAVAVATVVAAATALAQAYGLDLPLFAETRVPGGTFGNRNFMAHLLSLGLPALL
ncbi:MAG: hypothetical protein HGA98_02070, partial [Deltaproteobacteria bacterium]|nr:hypothetical protein [Deltaproteobacteria bacterium]